MNGPEHYREAERLLALALKHEENGLVPRSVDVCHAQAQVHATLALAAATIEAADHDPDGWRLIGRPVPAQHGDPAYPGTPWGRAFFGDRHLDEGGDQA